VRHFAHFEQAGPGPLPDLVGERSPVIHGAVGLFVRDAIARFGIGQKPQT